MKVSFVLPGYWREPGGGASVVYRLASGLAASGHDVTVAHVARFRTRPRPGEGRLRRQVEEIVSGRRDARRGAPDGPRWAPIDPRVTCTYHERFGPDIVPDGDVVVATAWQTAVAVADLAPAKGRGVYLVQGLETWSASEARIDATWRLPLRKVLIAGWLYDRAAAMGLDDIHRLVLAIDDDEYRLVRPIEDRAPRVLMLASPEPAKGLTDGVEALTRAKAAVPAMTACCFGVGRRPAALPAWIEYVQDPPRRVLVDDLYNSAAVYVCPSRGEGWHLVAAEAMACGAALVSTDIGGVADYARQGETALLSPVRDGAALGDNVIRLLGDAALRVRLARAGHAEIVGNDWARTTDTFERILRLDSVPAMPAGR